MARSSLSDCRPTIASVLSISQRAEGEPEAEPGADTNGTAETALAASALAPPPLGRNGVLFGLSFVGPAAATGRELGEEGAAAPLDEEALAVAGMLEAAEADAGVHSLAVAASDERGRDKGGEGVGAGAGTAEADAGCITPPLPLLLPSLPASAAL